MEAIKILDEEIKQYLPRLNEKQKAAVLTVVKTFAANQQGWWDVLGNEQKEAIDQSLVEMNEGKLTQHDEVMFQYKKWMPQ